MTQWKYWDYIHPLHQITHIFGKEKNEQVAANIQFVFGKT